MAAKAVVKKTVAKNAAKKAPAKKAAVVPAAAKAAGGVCLDDMPLTLSAELGRASKTLDDALKIGEQSLIELDKRVGDPVDIKLNGKLYARGEVVTVSENFGVRITEIVGEV
ncbi:MAG: flagellar motor switch protein FliN [Candidatus Latescibacterota bacterium]|jgi:flagellar motor switch protein FliN/FliY|tara:strand:- start:139 stop:474 length:336 start_codon:yes stop_codon:yes gene_type:complete